MAVRRRRPFGVVIRAAVVIVVGAVLTFLAALAVLAAVFLVAFEVVPNARAILFLSIIALAFSIFVLAAGIGLYNLRPWAWWLAVIALSAQLLGAVGKYGLGWRPVFWENLAFLIPVFSLVYLVAVRRQFR